MSFARPSCDVRHPKNIPVVLMRTPPTRESVMSRLKAGWPKWMMGWSAYSRACPAGKFGLLSGIRAGPIQRPTGAPTLNRLAPAMEMLLATRVALVHLRHSSFTASLFFMYDFRP